MTHCAKCGAELIGTRKFCTACGAPAGDPRSPAASTGMSPAAPGSVPSIPSSRPQSAGPAIQYAPPPPVSTVDPFARTAGPATAEQAAKGLVAAAAAAPPYGPPPSIPLELQTTTPGVGDPARGPQVSPLATSNVDSGAAAIVDAIVRSARAPMSGQPAPAAPPARQGSSPDSSPSGIKRGIPGTQLMPSIPNPNMVPSATPGGAGVPSAGQPSAVKRPDRTQLIGIFPGVPGAPQPHSIASPSGPAASSATSGVPGSQPGTPSTTPIAPMGRRDSSIPGVPPPPPQPQPSTAPLQQHSGPGVPLPVAPGWQPPPPQPPPPQPPAPSPFASSGPLYPHQMQPPPPQPPQPPHMGPQSYGYGFSYVPGSRVTVTWSNGQRYPGSITQVNGNQCLVVFPDGQHHWVEMQYLAPA